MCPTTVVRRRQTNVTAATVLEVPHESQIGTDYTSIVVLGEGAFGAGAPEALAGPDDQSSGTGGDGECRRSS